MNGLKVFLVPVLILAALVIGGKIVYDLKLLKADISSFRTYVMALPVPGQCAPPGMHVSSTTCSYQLEVTGVIDKEKGFYRARNDPKLYEASYTQCEKAKGTLREGFKDLPYECLTPDQQPNKDIEYAFYVDNDKNLGNGSHIFESVPYTPHLIVIKK